MTTAISTTGRFRYLWSSRFWLASFVALLLPIVVMASMSLWLPAGDAQVDNLVIPLILFPLIWAVSFFYAVLETNLKRAWMVMLGLLLVNGGMVAGSIAGVLS
jgi:membrane-anchored glycerophosphoryl diester phosphodiesterase (GDPDase)